MNMKNKTIFGDGMKQYKTLFLSLIIPLLFTLLFYTPETYADNKIDSNNFIIQTDKEYYNCLPIISKDGCIISGTVYITNNDDKNHNIDLGLDFSTDVKIRDHKDIRKVKSKNFKSDKKTLIKKGETLTIPFSFYTKESGKFDYYIDTGTFEVRLDPYYNVTYNTTNPSLQLFNGALCQFTDDEFEHYSNIYQGLSDNDLDTSYYTFKHTIHYAGMIYQQQNMSNEDSYGIDIFGDHLYILDDTGGTVNNTDDKIRKYDLDTLTYDTTIQLSGGGKSGDGIYITEGYYHVCDNAADRIYWYLTTDGSADQNTDIDNKGTGVTNCVGMSGNYTHLFIVGDDNDIVQTYLTPAKTYIREWFLVAGNDDPGAINYYQDGDYLEVYDRIDNLIYMYERDGTYLGNRTGLDLFTDGYGYDRDDNICYVVSDSLLQLVSFYCDTEHIPDGTAIKVNFNITLNTSNQYFLEITTLGTDPKNVTIFSYNSTDMIDNTNYVQEIISSGTDYVNITSLINERSEFRLWTNDEYNISEVFLLENINDVTDPVINDCYVNDTDLICSQDYVKVCNITDDGIITDVYFDDVMASNIPGTDLYYTFSNFAYDNNGSIDYYYFNKVNVTDIGGNNIVEYQDINFTYSCDLDTDYPIVTLQYPSDLQVIDDIYADFNCDGYDSFGLSNVSLYTNLSGNFNLYNTRSLSGTNDTKWWYNVVIGYNETIQWNCYVCDINGLCDFAEDNRLFYTNQTFEIIIPDESGIVLYTPCNGCVWDSYLVDYSFENNVSGFYSLWVDTGTGFNQVNDLYYNTGLHHIYQTYYNNYTVNWYVRGNDSQSLTWTYYLNITDIPVEIPCDERLTQTNVFFLGFILFLSIVFMLMPVMLRIRELWLISGLFQLLISILFFFYLPVCYSMNFFISLVFFGLGLFFMTYYFNLLRILK